MKIASTSYLFIYFQKRGKCEDCLISHFATKRLPICRSRGHPIIISDLPVGISVCALGSLVDFEIFFLRDFGHILFFFIL